MENRKTITEKTTLSELLEILNLGEKPDETPKPKVLRETAGEPVAVEERCTVYRNGWAVYDNGSGRTVVWLPDCMSFTYQFGKPKKNEALSVSTQESLPEGLLASQPWPLAVTLVGDHRVEENSMNRQGSRHGKKVFDDPDWDFGEDEKQPGDNCFLKRMFRLQEYAVENPETTYIRKEIVRGVLEALDEKQRKALVLYAVYGYTQEEIAYKFGVTQPAVSKLLSRTCRKTKEFYKNNFS